MLRFTLCFLISLFVAFANSKIPIPSTRQIEPRADDSIYRLPNSTRPEAYVIDINTNIHNGTFEFGGLVAIDLEVLEATSSIILHQRQLSIASLTLETNPANGMTINVLPFTYDVITEFLNITVTNEPLTVGGKYTLKIVYSGMLRTDEAGFYRSSYIADDLSRRWLATTQFESTDARHGFPCYDEPAFRANFTINIRHDASYHAISNMPVNGVPSSNGDGTVTTRFQTTPKTPTYLIAYIVSDFARRDNAINTQSFPHATYARPNAIHGADYSVYMAEEILRSFDQHLTINFSHALPKMDQVAVPDFAAGAMENWGLVTYREPYLLWFENSTFTTKTNM